MTIAAIARVDAREQTEQSVASLPRTCAELAAGERAMVVRLAGDPALRGRLRALGIRPGLPLTVIRRAPWGCPIEVAVRHVHLALRREDAEAILIAPRG